jgi:hypothetical protein
VVSRGRLTNTLEQSLNCLAENHQRVNGAENFVSSL